MDQLAPTYAVSFSPNGGTAARIVKLIEQANTSIDAAIYEFTSQRIANAMAAASRRGVKVRLLADAHEAAKHCSAIPTVKSTCADVRLESRFHIFHNKFLIIDQRSVTTGSYNWTTEAEIGNAENSITLDGPPDLIAQYAAQFDGLWSSAA